MELKDFVVLVKRDHFTCPKCNSVAIGLEKFRIHEKWHQQLYNVGPVVKFTHPGCITTSDKEGEAGQTNEEGEKEMVSSASEINSAILTSASNQKLTKRVLQRNKYPYKCWLCSESQKFHWSFVKHMESHKARNPELVAGLIRLIPAMRRERIDYNREKQ